MAVGLTVADAISSGRRVSAAVTDREAVIASVDLTSAESTSS